MTITTYLIAQLVFWIGGGGLLAYLQYDMGDMGDRTALVLWLVVCAIQIGAAAYWLAQ